MFYDFSDEPDVIKFRKDTHVFRHPYKDAMNKREQWSDRKKDLYIRIGIILVTEIFQKSIAMLI